MSGKKYVLHPGEVISRNDAQIHHISAIRLADLYGVDPRECIVAGPGIRMDDAIHLYPRSDGNYRLPDTGAER